MRFLPLIFRNILRNRRRTVLTLGGIGLSVFVISALLAVESGFRTLAGSAGDSLLNVYEKGLACPVTSRILDGHLRTIRTIPRVVTATGVLRGLYTYKDKENLLTVAGVEYEAFRRFQTIEILEGSEEAFLARTDAALVGSRAANRYGWHVGQTVSLVEDGLTFQVAGIFRNTEGGRQESVVLHKSFLEKLKRDEGRSTFFIVRVSDPDAVDTVSRTIDEAFANSPKPTKTQSEKASREQELKDFSELRRMLSAMVLATILASVFGAANSVSMSVRERTREVGILRSLGLRRADILAIVLGESALVACVGGALGIGAALGLVTVVQSLGGFIPLTLGPWTVAAAIGVAALIGLLGGLLPAARASRLAIVDALRLVD